LCSFIGRDTASYERWLPKIIPKMRYQSVKPGEAGGVIKIFHHQIWKYGNPVVIFVPVLTTSLIKKG
jgi:hypothetical protein